MTSHVQQQRPPQLALRAAIDLWRSGRSREAELACEGLLANASEDPDAITLLAEIYSATGRPELAGCTLQRLLRLQPGNAATYRRLGDAWLAAGEPRAAAAALERAIEIEPASARAHNNLGQALLQLGRPLEALWHCDHTLELREDYAIGHNNRGRALAELGRLEEALVSYQTAAAFDKGLWEAHCNCGNVLLRLQRLPEALSCYARAIELQPTAIDALLNRGTVLQQLCRFEAALADYERVLDLQPGHTTALTNKAAALLALKRATAALACCDRALFLDPDLAPAHHVRARALQLLGRYAEAVAACERAVELAPDSPDLWCSRGALLDDLCELHAARECYLRALALDAHCLTARLRLLTSHIPIVPDSEVEIAQSRHALAEELDRFEEWARSGALADREAAELVDQFFYLAYQGYCNRALLERYRGECARLMSRWQTARCAAALPQRAVLGRTRMRIAVVSAHLIDHSVYKALVQGWLRSLDRDRFEFHLYHVGVYQDAETSAAAALSDEFTAGPRTLEAWVAAIHSSNPDVLIFPEVGMNTTTLRLAALRLAPHQIAAWGHPETTGLPTIDYYLSAAAFEPSGAQQHYSEQLVPLPALGCCYDPYGVETADLELGRLGITQEGPLFVCAGLPFKYAPQHDHVLTDIAQRVGDCRFLFFTAPSTTATERLAQRLARAFERAGLEPARYLKIVPWLSRVEFFGVLRQADLYLDTIGFSGFNTTMQAIECGLPVVAYRGSYMRGRFASGILDTLQLAELIADDKPTYVERAVRIARDPALRARLREQMISRQQRIFSERTAIAGLSRFLSDLPPRAL
jgi:protein O-GlcNAc transferase